jgi:hypothetical protein
VLAWHTIVPGKKLLISIFVPDFERMERGRRELAASDIESNSNVERESDGMRDDDSGLENNGNREDDDDRGRQDSRDR